MKQAALWLAFRAKIYFMIAVGSAALFLMVSLVTAAVSAPGAGTGGLSEGNGGLNRTKTVINLTQAVDKDTDPVEHVVVVGVYPAGDASKVEYFTYQTLFPTRKACTEFQESDIFKSSLAAFLMHLAAERGPVGINIRCLARGSPT